MDDALDDIGPEIIGKKRRPLRTGTFDDPPVPRAAAVIGGFVIATLIALLGVSYVLMLVDKPSTRPSIPALSDGPE